MFAAGTRISWGESESSDNGVDQAYSRLQSHERILIFRARVRTVTDNTRLHLIFTASQLILLFPRHPFLFTISNAQNMIYASDLTNS